ncbi:potassium-transporting ATPase subunit KdpC [Methyloversatilis thermotolerans]|uniref:potassium-transporting ATPase subunit KdpC n=1 Tax=Methyloversatilis thermotolerans TaxID=1346290 RepID=UPI0003AA4600
MNAFIDLLRPALSVLVLLTALTGGVYPLLVTAIAHAVWPEQAAGSLLRDGDRVVGSALIGQPFSDPGHFWPRPSATANRPYDATASGGSNLGANNPQLLQAVAEREAALRAADPAQREALPVDLVTASASGLDPDISVAAALWQAPRVANARGLPRGEVDLLIEREAGSRWLGFIGEPTVNVLALNRALDRMLAQ